MQCYAWNLCEIYDVTCCSENPKKHLPYQCEFIDNGILSSYAKGVYSYYDVQQIEEFVAFKGAYEIASLIETYDATLYKSENFAILKYCYDDCYDPVDSFEISPFDDACYACGQDANMNYAYGDNLL